LGTQAEVTLEVLNRIDRVEEKTCRVFGACISFSPSRCCAFVPGVLACVHMYMLWGGGKPHQTGVFYAGADNYTHGDRSYEHYGVYLYPYSESAQGVHMHSCMRILFMCTVQALYYREGPNDL